MPANATPRNQPVAKARRLPRSSSAPAVLAMDLHARAGDAAALLKALANPDRLLLLCQLLGGERSVGELGLSAGIEQPSLSQQLGVLRGERLVATRREGKQMIYRIASPAALTVLEALYGLFCDPAQAQAAVKTGRISGRTSGRPPGRSPPRTAARSGHPIT